MSGGHSRFGLAQVNENSAEGNYSSFCARWSRKRRARLGEEKKAEKKREEERREERKERPLEDFEGEVVGARADANESEQAQVRRAGADDGEVAGVFVDDEEETIVRR